MEFKRISVIGLGYIGLPTAAVLASRGLQVIGVDVNQDAVDIINAGKIHIVEPDLDIVVRSVVSTGNLKATTIPEPADVFMIAVPTPFYESDDDSHKPNLSYIQSAAKAIAPVMTVSAAICWARPTASPSRPNGRRKSVASMPKHSGNWPAAWLLRARSSP